MKQKSCKLKKAFQEKTSIIKMYSVWGVVSLLTLLVLVGNYLGNGKTNAKYVSSMSGSDQARVACFVSDVTAPQAESNVKLSPTTTDWVTCYTFTVTNKKNGKTCEVSMDYQLTIKIESGPSGVIYQVSSVEPNSCSPSSEVKAVNGKADIGVSGGVFAAGVDKLHTYKIEAKWDPTADKSFKNANLPITVSVSADVVQKD